MGKNTIKIYVHLFSQSNPIEYINVINAYTKDGLYCIFLSNGKYHKFPLCNIFRIIEETE